MMTRTYSELMELRTFQERFHYLVLNGSVGHSTFGNNRYLNQNFYRSKEWRRVRNDVIIRDGGCDLGIPGLEIVGMVIVHHINPITIDDVKNRNPILFDPEFLISTQLNTHNAIHYGDETLLISETPLERSPNDTKLW